MSIRILLYIILFLSCILTRKGLLVELVLYHSIIRLCGDRGTTRRLIVYDTENRELMLSNQRSEKNNTTVFRKKIGPEIISN